MQFPTAVKQRPRDAFEALERLRDETRVEEDEAEQEENTARGSAGKEADDENEALSLTLKTSPSALVWQSGCTSALGGLVFGFDIGGVRSAAPQLLVIALQMLSFLQSPMTSHSSPAARS